MRKKKQAEAATCICSSKQVFLKVLQYSQENACVEVSFCRSQPFSFIKNRFQRRCFSVNIAKFIKTTFLYRAPLVTASERTKSLDTFFKNIQDPLLYDYISGKSFLEASHCRSNNFFQKYHVLYFIKKLTRFSDFSKKLQLFVDMILE